MFILFSYKDNKHEIETFSTFNEAEERIDNKIDSELLEVNALHRKEETRYDFWNKTDEKGLHKNSPARIGAWAGPETGECEMVIAELNDGEYTVVTYSNDEYLKCCSKVFESEEDAFKFVKEEIDYEISDSEEYGIEYEQEITESKGTAYFRSCESFVKYYVIGSKFNQFCVELL